MGGNDYDKRVDRTTAEENHDRRRDVHPITGEEVPPPGIPILRKAKNGKVLDKRVRIYTIKCPDCLIPARYDEKSMAVCPECGTICGGEQMIAEDRLKIDAKTAGRIDSD